MSRPPDFSSQQYWETRFEKETSFEWLARSEVVLPIVLETFKEVIRAGTSNTLSDESPFRLLHFGCGSSSLGSDIQHYLDQARIGSQPPSDAPQTADTDMNVNDIISLPPIEVIDADYVPPNLLSDAPRSVPLIQLDVLDPSSLASASPEEGWDLLIDKSTADAISCGQDIPDPTTGTSTSPLHALLDNLAKFTRQGGRWISISYSATRYDCLQQDLPDTTSGLQTTSEAADAWRLISRTPLGSTAIPGGRLVADGKGWRRVYEPETPIWLYVLERI
jgi:hypothetical protein